jgi:RHS repeat-associated protein
LANGKTIFNNKGKPVKQYEPYFSSVGHQYEEPTEEGVTPILYYDAIGRQIRTEMPDGTFTKLAFSPWFSSAYDANDTILESGNIWYTNHIAGTATQQRAASISAVHANTPATVHFDGLGREVIAILHNRYEQESGITEEKFVTYTKLDSEGKPLWIEDARGNRVMEYINTPGAIADYAPTYDIAGNLLFQHSMDSGNRWMLMNSGAQAFYAWDENEGQDDTGTILEFRVMRSLYDALRRPLEMQIKVNDGDWKSIERIQYGESLSNASEKNLRGKVYRHFDSGGLTVNEHFDFKGNLLKTSKQLSASYDQSLLDWNTETVSTEVFTQRTQYDAINRMVFLENWHLEGRTPSTYTPTYNQRGLLRSEIHSVNGSAKEAVLHIEYNAKGQRTRMQYDNGSTTRYHYDSSSFRLLQLRTTRNSPGEGLPRVSSNLSDPNVLQNLYYTYDPSGNITEIFDDAYEPIFFNNQQVESRSRYTYDALYRLIQAEGRENGSLDQAPQHGKTADIPAVSFPIHDPQASRNYIQDYRYDSVGNILQMKHRAGVGNFSQRWTQNYTYATDSNRLLRSQTGSDAASIINYRYDTHGSMLNLGNVSDEYHMNWDHRDMISTVNLGGGGRAFYNYHTNKQRCRKRIERPDGTVEERIYLNGMELYRRWNNGSLQEEIESHHLFVDDQRILIAEHIISTNNNLLTTGILYRYQYSNHLGSVGLECDGTAQVISYEEYHPFGTTAYHAKNTTINASAKRYKYTGMERDEETGMSYHTARYYLPWLGRWLSADPIGIKAGPNFYTYVENNPINSSDISGLQSANDIGMDMMWTRMGQELSAMWTGVFGGSAYISPQTNTVNISGPTGGVGGVTGGAIRAVTFRAVPIEDHPTYSSLVGMEFGAGLVPIADPAARLATGATVTGQDTSQGWAALELALDVIPLALEFKAARVASMESKMLRIEIKAADNGVHIGSAGKKVSGPSVTNPTCRGDLCVADVGSHAANQRLNPGQAPVTNTEFVQASGRAVSRTEAPIANAGEAANFLNTGFDALHKSGRISTPLQASIPTGPINPGNYLVNIKGPMGGHAIHARVTTDVVKTEYIAQGKLVSEADALDIAADGGTFRTRKVYRTEFYDPQNEVSINVKSSDIIQWVKISD